MSECNTFNRIARRMLRSFESAQNFAIDYFINLHWHLLNSSFSYTELHPQVHIEKVPPQQIQVTEATRHLVNLNLQGSHDGKDYTTLSLEEKMIYLR